jgi:hypothetical protein
LTQQVGEVVVEVRHGAALLQACINLRWRGQRRCSVQRSASPSTAGADAPAPGPRPAGGTRSAAARWSAARPPGAPRRHVGRTCAACADAAAKAVCRAAHAPARGKGCRARVRVWLLRALSALWLRPRGSVRGGGQYVWISFFFVDSA